MTTVGIICEYNPLHLGHRQQFEKIREKFGHDCAIVCLMSGNYVQRGEPAIMDKSVRAKAAILCGADLVLELPVTYALSSAEGFASGGVRILSPFCDYLSFGAETPNWKALMQTAELLLSPGFSARLQEKIATGCSFPAARQAAAEEMGIEPGILSSPNNILATEYCKAICSQKSALIPFPIQRPGAYHDEIPNADAPSATAVRKQMLSGNRWRDYIPEQARSCYDCAPLHTLHAGERAVLSRLRTMTDSEFEAVPYGSEGLWRKLMHASRTQSTLDDILSSVKSKRYTFTRISRMTMCAFLGLTEQMMVAPAPYVRVLAFNDTGRLVLKSAQKTQTIINAGQKVDSPYWELEKRCADLYSLFSVPIPGAPGLEEKQRVFYLSASAQSAPEEAADI